VICSELERIIDKTLKKDRNVRYQHASAEVDHIQHASGRAGEADCREMGTNARRPCGDGATSCPVTPPSATVAIWRPESVRDHRLGLDTA
jgi:hypothetical protein